MNYGTKVTEMYSEVKKDNINPGKQKKSSL